MTCCETERQLPGYLDGAVLSGAHAIIREHLDSCGDCRKQLELYRRLAACMVKIEPVPPPPGLAARIRVQASQLDARSWARKARVFWNRASLVFENILEPLAVPATGGFLAALGIFVLVAQSFLIGPSVRAAASDAQLGLEPASVESLASFPISAMSDSGTLLLEATVDSQGQLVSYRILSGPDNPAVERQVYQILLFSRFRPQVNFGLPMNGGHVMLGFNALRVRG